MIIEYEIKSVRNTIEETIHQQGYKTSGYENDVIKVWPTPPIWDNHQPRIEE